MCRGRKGHLAERADRFVFIVAAGTGGAGAGAQWDEFLGGVCRENTATAPPPTKRVPTEDISAGSPRISISEFPKRKTQNAKGKNSKGKNT